MCLLGIFLLVRMTGYESFSPEVHQALILHQVAQCGLPQEVGPDGSALLTAVSIYALQHLGGSSLAVQRPFPLSSVHVDIL